MFFFSYGKKLYASYSLVYLKEERTKHTHDKKFKKKITLVLSVHLIEAHNIEMFGRSCNVVGFQCTPAMQVFFSLYECFNSLFSGSLVLRDTGDYKYTYIKYVLMYKCFAVMYGLCIGS